MDTLKPAKGRTGRPTKLNDDIIKTITDAIRAGMYIEQAASLGGIHKDTLYDWLRRGDGDDGIYHQFTEAVKKANAEFEFHAIRQINGAAENGIWQAAAWKLERRFPDRWGTKARLEVEPVIPKKLEPLDLSSLTNEELELARKLGVMMLKN